MIIDCISDLHGYNPKLEGGDLLICAGDCTSMDRVSDWMEFFNWFKAQDYKHKVLVAGNHDGFLERCLSSEEDREFYAEIGEVYEDNGFEYLCDSGIEVEGLKIWGSPWTPKFCEWHFMLDRGDRIKQKWSMIPDDTDILVTHGPAYGCMDKATRYDQFYYEHVGCHDLNERLTKLPKLKLHVFGHIHEDYGMIPAYNYDQLKKGSTIVYRRDYISVNCAIMDMDYKPVNKPIRVIL